MFYIDKDLKSNRVYIATTVKTELGPFVIECDKAYKAHELVKKLNASLLKSPSHDLSLWEELKPLTGPLGSVRVFKVRG